MKFLCDQCKAKYQIADDKIAGKTVKMKCRKCGHQIEVRAAVTETSVASKVPADERPAAPGEPPRPGNAPRAPAAPKLATSLAAAKPAPPRAATPPPKPDRNDKPGALAGAFKHSVQKEEEISASFDLAELSASDEWYVAINGVPVGPIRVQEVRRKAALGAVTEDSLVWQEGLEEWRPVRAFAELAAVVREAAMSGRTSLLTPAPPQVDVRPNTTSNRPAPPRASGAPRPATSPVPAQARVAMSPAPPNAAAARSNVVPITSRLATAERLDDATVPLTDDLRVSVAPDPFAAPSGAAAAAGLTAPAPRGMSASATDVGFGAAALASQPLHTASAVPAEPAPQKRAPPWMAIAMIVLAAAFGITAALALFLKPQPPQPVVIQMSGAPNVAPPPSGNQATPLPTDTSPLPQASGASSSQGKVLGGGSAIAAVPKPSATPSATSGGFKVSGLDDTGPKVGGGSTSGGAEAPKPGQCLTQAQVQGVIQGRQSGLKRTCWDKSPSTRATVNISVMLTIGPGGEVQSVQANGEDSSVANCVQSDVRTWHFPAAGCVQQSGFAVHFVRQ